MGGRGSAYQKLVNKAENLEQFQNEQYNGEKVNPDDFINDKETEIQNDMFHLLKNVGISTRESTDKVNRQSLTTNQKQAHFIATEFDYLLNETKIDVQLGSENIKDKKISGYTAPWYNNGLQLRVVLDDKRLNNPTEARKEITKSVSETWHVPINVKENANKYTITHEMGHAIEECIFEKLRKNNSHNPEYHDSKKLATNIRNEVKEIYKNQYAKPGENVNMNISEYSRKNSMEWFAETFSNLVLSDKPMPVALALNDFLERFK